MVSRLDVCIKKFKYFLYLRLLIKILFNYSYYDMHVDKFRDLINAIDNKKTVFNISPIISKKLRDLLDIPEPIDKHKQTEDELAKQIEDIRKLLDEANNNKNDTKDKNQ